MPDGRKVFNFSAGPTTLPKAVYDECEKDMHSYKDTGIPVMELIHLVNVDDTFAKISTDCKD